MSSLVLLSAGSSRPVRAMMLLALLVLSGPLLAENHLPTAINGGILIPCADRTQPVTITYQQLLTLSGAADEDSDTIYFGLSNGLVNEGTLTKNGVPITDAVTPLGPGESWVWTPSTVATDSRPRAFEVSAFDVVSLSLDRLGSGIHVFFAIPAAGNQVPTLTSVVPLTAPAGNAPLTITYAQLLAAANAHDADGDALQFVITSINANLGALYRFQTNNVGEETARLVTADYSPSVNQYLHPGERWEWRPVSGARGQAFSVRVYDGRGGLSTTQVPVSIAAPTPPPAPLSSDSGKCGLGSSVSLAGLVLVAALLGLRRRQQR